MVQRSSGRWWVGLALIGAGAIVSAYAMKFGGAAAVSWGLIRAIDAGSVQAAMVVISIVLWTTLGSMLVSRLLSRPMRPARIAACERGVLLAELVLVIPALILICGTVIQMILILNAMMVVNFAAVSAARAASISYVRSGMDMDEQGDPLLHSRMYDAACLVLSTVSPARGESSPISAGGGDDPRDPELPPPPPQDPTEGPEIDSMATALSTILGDMDARFGGRTIGLRVGYARTATRVSHTDWVPEFPHEFTSNRILLPPREILVTVEYDFFLALNGLAFLPGLSQPLPDDTSGRIFTVSASQLGQSSGARVPAPGTITGPFPRP